jgi:hypothetical protein
MMPMSLVKRGGLEDTNALVGRGEPVRGEANVGGGEVLGVDVGVVEIEAVEGYSEGGDILAVGLTSHEAIDRIFLNSSSKGRKRSQPWRSDVWMMTRVAFMCMTSVNTPCRSFVERLNMCGLFSSPSNSSDHLSQAASSRLRLAIRSGSTVGWPRCGECEITRHRERSRSISALRRASVRLRNGPGEGLGEFIHGNSSFLTLLSVNAHAEISSRVKCSMSSALSVWGSRYGTSRCSAGVSRRYFLLMISVPQWRWVSAD